MTEPKFSDMPAAKKALADAIAGLEAEGLPEAWVRGVVDVFCKMADDLLAGSMANLESTLAAAIRRVYDMEAVENDRYAQALDGIPGQHAAASWHRAMADRFRAKAKVVPDA